MNFIVRLLRPRRPPEVTIGGEDRPYMRRWWLIPRNRFANAYLHHVLRDDDDRALHDHPWLSCSIVLAGGYVEVMRRADGCLIRRYRRPGALVFRRASTPHRLELPRGEFDGVAAPSWSLLLTGPVLRSWGFRCRKGWIHWRDFTAGPSGETVGAGCDRPTFKLGERGWPPTTPSWSAIAGEWRRRRCALRLVLDGDLQRWSAR